MRPLLDDAKDLHYIYVNGMRVPPHITWEGTGVLVVWTGPVDRWNMLCLRNYIITQTRRFDDYDTACMAASLCSAAVA